ncbi:MAG TPA: glycosyltransferase family 2 protein [Cyclobacteriaceae bacterium]|nr:glycosyltransferase family 2 protein [Cyclobacteriaceae bacterium]
MSKIFIFIPVYNASAYVVEAIESVIHQTYTDWELLVLDDQSTDNSFELCKAFEKKYPRITVTRNDRNLGMVGNWNEGVSKCKSEFFIKLDADDKWLPTMLEKSIVIMEKYREVAIVFSKYINIDSKSNPVEGSEITLPEFAKNKSFSCVPLVEMGSDEMLQYSILRQGLSLIRNSVFNEVGSYRYLITRETEAASDTEFYFRVGCNHEIYCIDEVLYQYRVHEESISAIDVANGLSQKKMLEIKSVINDYYLQQEKITIKQWKKNKKATDFNHLLNLNYRARVNKRYSSVINTFIRLFVFYPDNFFLHLKNKI